MSKKRIKSVEKGWGQGSIFFTTDTQMVSILVVANIQEESKQNSESTQFNTYVGYNESGDVVFEMGATVDVTVTYWID